MYEQFYGFYESPFNITPDPRFLYLSDRHQEAFDHLIFGIKERKGFIQITGEVGTGKTTLCRALLEELGPQFKTALILNPCMTGPQLLRSILIEFGETPRGQDRVECLHHLNDFLLAQVTTGHEVVLIIDEAQDLSPALMEQVRLLSNLETDQQKLLQIVLIGQSELKEMLDHPSLRQLRQRITVRYHLTPLSFSETRSYIDHRLHLAGANGRLSFSHWALRKIHGYSRGVPRLINAVCDKALLCGYVVGTDRLTARHLRRAIRELEGELHMSLINEALRQAREEVHRRDAARRRIPVPRSTPRQQRGPWLVGAAVAVAVALGISIFVLGRLSSDEKTRPDDERYTAATSSGEEPAEILTGPFVASPEVGRTHQPDAQSSDAPGPEAVPARSTAVGAPSDLVKTTVGTVASADPVPVTPTAGTQSISSQVRVEESTRQNPPAAPLASRHTADGKVFVQQATLQDGRTIELGGIAWSELDPVALLNDRIVGQGERIEGLLVVEIERQQVELRGSDGTIFIRLE